MLQYGQFAIPNKITQHASKDHAAAVDGTFSLVFALLVRPTKSFMENKLKSKQKSITSAVKASHMLDILAAGPSTHLHMQSSLRTSLRPKVFVLHQVRLAMTINSAATGAANFYKQSIMFGSMRRRFVSRLDSMTRKLRELMKSTSTFQF